MANKRREILRPNTQMFLQEAGLTEGGKDALPIQQMWRAWIQNIVQDKDMNLERAMSHLVRHIRDHAPDPRRGPMVAKERWEEWLAGTYNLLAIVGGMLNLDPPHELGVELMLRKWLTSPFDHTAPPETVYGETKRKPSNYERDDPGGS